MEFNEFDQFLNNIPPQLICNIALFFGGLIALTVYFGIVKPIRKRLRADAQSSLKRETREIDMVDGFYAHDDQPALASLTALPVASPAAAPAVKIPPRKTGEYLVKLTDGTSARAVEVLTILRDSADDRMVVYLENVGYRTLLDQPEIKAKFTALMKELAETIIKPDTPRPEIEPMPIEEVPALDDLDLPDVDALATLPPPPPTPKPAPRPIISPSNPASAAAAAGIPGALPDYRSQTNTDPKVTKRGLFRAPKVEFAPLPELNLAASIEAYLQHKIMTTPEFYGRDLHVHPAEGGGVVIEVDDEYYEAVGDIQDTTTREFIANAIQEWQDKH